MKSPSQPQPAPGPKGGPAHRSVSTDTPNVGADRDWGFAAFWPAGARWRGVAWFLLILATYVASSNLVPWFGGIGLLWLPNAVLVTALLKFQPRDWPYVYSAGVLAEAVVTLDSAWSWQQILSLGVLNCAEATLFVFLAARIAGGRDHIGLLVVRGAIAVVIASIAAPIVTGTLGAAAVNSSWALDGAYLTTWRTLWFGDSLGLLVGVPIGLLFRDAASSVGRNRRPLLALAVGGTAALLSGTSTALAFEGNTWGAQQTAFAAAVTLALTFGAIGAPIGAVVMTTTTVLGVVRSHEGLESVTRSQVLLVVVFAAVYAIAATTESGSRINEDLQSANARLSSYVKTVEAAVERAEAANRAKSVFLATMSHELRTPLN